MAVAEPSGRADLIFPVESMKLTPELIGQSPSFLNAVKERQLDLRGNNIPAIENLGVTHDQHDCIDLTDNAVVSLANLPLLRRLKTLLLANNRVSVISPSLHLSAPNLTSLILTNNNISAFADLQPLHSVKSLKYLSLLSNPVRDKKWYREWLIFSIKSLRVLDFQRIRDKERSHARALFLTADSLPTPLANSISNDVSSINQSSISSAIDEPRPVVSSIKAGRLMTGEEKAKVRAAIANASTAEEVRRLEQQLREGWIPK